MFGKLYLFFYIESMVVCSAVFLILLLHDIIRGERSESTMHFDNVLVAHIMYFTVDCFWAAVISGAIPRTAFTVCFLNYVLLVLLSLIASTWFEFALSVMDLQWRSEKKGRLMAQLPMILSVVISFVLIIFYPSALIDDQLETTTLYMVLFLAAPVFYVVCGFIYSMREAYKKENVLKQKLLFVLGIYPLTVLLSGIVQALILQLPFFCFNSMVMIILFNLLTMESQISVDPLTKLNNRGELMRFALQGSSIHKERLKTYVIMVDANDFKKINDTYGHVEGDRALVMIANALKRAAGSMDKPPFIARFGGDEFVIIAYTDPDDDMSVILSELTESLNSSLADMCAKNEVPYKVALTLGCAELKRDNTFQDTLVQADEDLYKRKKRIGVGR